MFKETISDFKQYYGKPNKVALESFTTNDGETLENSKYYWQSGRETIEYLQYADDESQSNITFLLQSLDDSVKLENSEIIIGWNDIAGKTATGIDNISKFKFKDYFSKNGSLVEVRGKDERIRGKWTISETGYLCFEWKDSTDCGQLKVGKDEKINFIRYNKIIRQFDRFEYGKQ